MEIKIFQAKYQYYPDGKLKSATNPDYLDGKVAFTHYREYDPSGKLILYRISDARGNIIKENRYESSQQPKVNKLAIPHKHPRKIPVLLDAVFRSTMFSNKY